MYYTQIKSQALVNGCVLNIYELNTCTLLHKLNYLVLGIIFLLVNGWFQS